MATLNGNNVYLSWDGVQIDGYWTGDVSKDESVSTVDITAGSGATHVERASGLLDNSMSFSIVYDDENLASYISQLVSDEHWVITTIEQMRVVQQIERINNDQPLYHMGHMFSITMEKI